MLIIEVVHPFKKGNDYWGKYDKYRKDEIVLRLLFIFWKFIYPRDGETYDVENTVEPVDEKYRHHLF
jgi:hypothetical protein